VLNDHQLALDDDRRQHVKALVRLAGGEGHDTQHIVRAGSLDAPDAGHVVGA